MKDLKSYQNEKYGYANHMSPGYEYVRRKKRSLIRKRRSAHPEENFLRKRMGVVSGQVYDPNQDPLYNPKLRKNSKKHQNCRCGVYYDKRSPDYGQEIFKPKIVKPIAIPFQDRSSEVKYKMFSNN